MSSWASVKAALEPSCNPSSGTLWVRKIFMSSLKSRDVCCCKPSARWEEEAFWFLPFLDVMLKTCVKASCILPATSPHHFPLGLLAPLQEQVILQQLSVPHPAFWTFHPSPFSFYKRGRLVWELPKIFLCTMSFVWQRNCDGRCSAQNGLAILCCSVAVREWTFLREEKKVGASSSSFEHPRLRTLQNFCKYKCAPVYP